MKKSIRELIIYEIIQNSLYYKLKDELILPKISDQKLISTLISRVLAAEQNLWRERIKTKITKLNPKTNSSSNLNTIPDLGLINTLVITAKSLGGKK